MHEKHGRAHLHVVWCRMDYDTGTLRSDSQNYLKHEQASLQLEREFGHEIVPGKHAKRDREKQPEFPRQDHDFVEAQMAERSPMTVEDRKEQIRALHAAAANGQAFKKALEDAGYILAQGDRGYLVVDQAGVHSALSRNLQGVKKAQVDAFMADVPLDRLPTIEEAKVLQEAKALSAQQPGAPDAAPAKPADMSLDERKAQITGIRKTCDDAQAFKNALEEAGYVLARGDKRGYVLVDEQGEIYSLSKHLTDIKGKEYKAFMAPIDMAALPDSRTSEGSARGTGRKSRETAPGNVEIPDARTGAEARTGHARPGKSGRKAPSGGPARPCAGASRCAAHRFDGLCPEGSAVEVPAAGNGREGRDPQTGRNPRSSGRAEGPGKEKRTRQEEGLRLRGLRPAGAASGPCASGSTD